MYMPGRFRTGSSPSRTVMSFSVYLASIRSVDTRYLRWAPFTGRSSLKERDPFNGGVKPLNYTSGNAIRQLGQPPNWPGEIAPRGHRARALVGHSLTHHHLHRPDDLRPQNAVGFLRNRVRQEPHLRRPRRRRDPYEQQPAIEAQRGRLVGEPLADDLAPPSCEPPEGQAGGESPPPAELLQDRPNPLRLARAFRAALTRVQCDPPRSATPSHRAGRAPHRAPRWPPVLSRPAPRRDALAGPGRAPRTDRRAAGWGAPSPPRRRRLPARGEARPPPPTLHRETRTPSPPGPRPSGSGRRGGVRPAWFGGRVRRLAGRRVAQRRPLRLGPRPRSVGIPRPGVAPNRQRAWRTLCSHARASSRRRA